MIASGTYHGATANKIRPTMMPAIAHLAWGVIDDSIHPGWDAAPRRLPGTPADARYARHHRNEQPACQIPPWHLRGHQTTMATRSVRIRHDGWRANLEGPVTISMPVEPAANELLSTDPLALLIGMLLDQQVPLERAFSAPYDLTRRLGHTPRAGELASYDPEALAAVFAERPALHRYPKSMAARMQALAQLIVDRYGGHARRGGGGAAEGAALRGRIAELRGFGSQKPQIFLALLGKQLGVHPAGWREAAGPFGEVGSYCSVADISDEDSLARVRAY